LTVSEIKKDKPDIVNLQYCTKHSFGATVKGSVRQKQHILESKEKCRFVKYNPKKHNPNYDESKIINDDEDENLKDSKKVYDFAQDKIIKKIRSAGDHNRVYALVKVNSHYKTIELGSWDSIQWIKSIYESATGEFYNDELYKTALSVIVSHAITDEIKIEKIYSRIAFVKDEIFYDLCNDKYELVKITKNGHSTIQINENTPIFRRKSSPLSQVIPKKSRLKNPLDEFCNLLKIQQQYRQLFKIHLISLFLESHPIPLMVFHGEQGSAKSTITSTIKKIIDPSPENLASMPKKIDDLNIHLHNRYISNFDNISYFDQEVSDNLCRAITGHTHIKRELYQDSKEIILLIQTRIILNGISPNIEFPDLMQRSIFYETRYIPKDERLTEEEFNKKIDLLIPSLLNQVFDTLSNILSIFDTVKSEITTKERMADFTVFGECISRSLGFDNFTFLETYKHNLDSNSLGASESWPIIDIVLDIFKNKETPFEISVDELYSQSSNIADSKDMDRKSKYSKFPKITSSFSNQLTRFSEVFRNSDYQLTIYKYNSRDNKFKRGKSILKVSSSTHNQSKLGSGKRPVSPVPQCQDENQAQNDSKTDMGQKSTLSATVSEKNQAQNHTKTDTGTDNGTDVKNQGAVPKNDKSSHKNGNWYGDTDDTGDLSTLDKNSKNKKSDTKPVIIKDVNQTMQKLRNSNFEVKGYGTVKCKFCNSKMNIPEATNHICQKRKESINE
jgi:hypothetical protein